MMQRKKVGPLAFLALLAVFFLALGLFGSQMTQVNAQTAEICDNKIDDDGDKLIDCDDPDCEKECQPPSGEGCSPGYWKNHEDEFNSVCGSVPGWTCADLWAAVNCKGKNSTCRRSEAAEALNAVSGCTE